MAFGDDNFSDSQRSTSPAAAETPALAPSLFSKSYIILIFENLLSSCPTGKISLSPHLLTPLIWVVHEFSELSVLIPSLSRKNRQQILLSPIFSWIAKRLYRRLARGCNRWWWSSSLAWGIFLQGLPALLTPLSYSICMRRGELSLAGRGRLGSLWRSSSVLIYGTLYMEIMMLF